MSIIIDKLTKTYGLQKAIDNISFQAYDGRITGFLGPNGAGKTTTMKITTGYISPSSGGGSIGGYAIGKENLHIKKIIGYLPEHNPLYLDLYVKEYLNFIGKVYKIKKLKSNIEKIIEQCGLTEEQNKKIRTLSKGYKQRVGLAQSLIHNPKILILDEPTGGLDPNQLVEIRKVIRTVSQEKTVILSSHIMQEVEALCDRIIIINKGKIVADDDLDNLKNKANNQFIYTLTFDEPIDKQLFIKNNIPITQESDTFYTISSDVDIRKSIMDVVINNKLLLSGISRKTESLEKIFQDLTNKSTIL